jgi:hypothetical protein
MKKSEKTRNQLLYTVAFLTLFSVMIAGISFMLFQKMHEIYKMNGSMHKIYEHYKSASNSEENFLYKETADPGFMGSEESFSTKNFTMHLKAMHLRLDEIGKLRNEISKYETLFTFAQHKADEEGIDNFGSSIQLQKNELELEQRSEQIGLSNVLSLEKIEKDYLLKNDVSYITALESKVQTINADISRNGSFDFQQKVLLIKLLHDFRYSFLDLVKSKGTLGFKNEEQLNDHIFQSKEAINKQFVMIDKKLAMKEQMLTSNIENVLLIFIINMVTLTFFVIFLYTRKGNKIASHEEVYEQSDEKIFKMPNSAMAS